MKIIGRREKKINTPSAEVGYLGSYNDSFSALEAVNGMGFDVGYINKVIVNDDGMKTIIPHFDYTGETTQLSLTYDNTPGLMGLNWGNDPEEYIKIICFVEKGKGLLQVYEEHQQLTNSIIEQGDLIEVIPGVNPTWEKFTPQELGQDLEVIVYANRNMGNVSQDSLAFDHSIGAKGRRAAEEYNAFRAKRINKKLARKIGHNVVNVNDL